MRFPARILIVLKPIFIYFFFTFTVPYLPNFLEYLLMALILFSFFLSQKFIRFIDPQIVIVIMALI